MAFITTLDGNKSSLAAVIDFILQSTKLNYGIEKK